MRKIKKEIIEALKYVEFHKNESITSIAKKFNIDKKTLFTNLELNIDDLIWSNNFDCYILFENKEWDAIDEYVNSNINFSKIKEKYGYKQERFVEKLKALDIDTSRKYKISFNRKVLSEIKTEEDAYILGFILADGYINEDKNTLRIKLNSKDIDILEKINTYFESNSLIKHEKHNFTGHDLAYISFYSKDLVNTLKKYDLFQGKSCKEIPYYKISENLKKHYIRGIIDGDGWIVKNNTGIGVCGSEEVLKFINEEIEKLIGKEELSKIRYNESSHIYRLSYSEQKAKTIINYLYKDSKIHLNRKYTLAKRNFD